MKIITWNCNMAYRKKAALLLAHSPDIVIVPECEEPARLKFAAGTPVPTDTLWFGTNPHKGLGIFSYSKYRFRVKKNHEPAIRMVVPVAVTGGDIDFTLYAIWANNPSDPDGPYVEQTWKALQHYKKHFNKGLSLLAGDFNSNTIWDRKSRTGNHSDIVKWLEKRDIHSCYHRHYLQEQGKESHPTFYLYRQQQRPYHLDYCFASGPMAEKIKTVEIGSYETWKDFSDHVPVMVTYNFEEEKKILH